MSRSRWAFKPPPDDFLAFNISSSISDSLFSFFQDSARVLSRFNDILLARVFGHEVIEVRNTYRTFTADP